MDLSIGFLFFRQPPLKKIKGLAMEPGVHNYSVVFAFERDHSEKKFHNYISQHWTDTYAFSAIYVLIVFGGKFLMKDRPKYDLRLLLALWSGILAIFSIFGAIRTIPELVTSISHHSLQYSVCIPTYFKGVTSFWAMMFTVSKVYELGDTVFIVLRKQKLIFLHWYHHITVMIYVWYSYVEHTAPGRWFMVMNYVVHSVMYTYYCLRALQFKLPQFVNMVITSMQLLQMIIGVSINIWIHQIKLRGEFCQQSADNWKYSTVMYFSYFVLFAHFFYTTYIMPKPVEAKKKA